MADNLIQKKTISPQVAEEIRKRILGGQYPGGLQLRQEHIAAELGISRIPVREPLHELHSEGSVTFVSHKGAVVSEISLEEIAEMFDLRGRLEIWLLELAIPHMTREGLAVARASAETYSEEDSGRKNTPLVSKTNGPFAILSGLSNTNTQRLRGTTGTSGPAWGLPWFGGHPEAFTRGVPDAQDA